MVNLPGCTLTVTGIDDALARVDGLEHAIRLAVVVELEAFGRLVTHEMIETHTFQNITGQLERSIGYSVEAWRGNAIVLNIYALASYAQEVEEGTPNSRPYPFFWPAIYTHLPELEPRLRTAVTTVLAEYGEGGERNFRWTGGDLPSKGRVLSAGRAL